MDSNKNRKESKLKSIFLSYSRKDLKDVKVIAQTLKAAGIRIWQDINSLDFGPTEDQIRNAIKKDCFSLLYYITKNSVGSKFIRDI